MDFLKRKTKNAFGPTPEGSFNWPLIGITLAALLALCGLVYVLVFPALFGSQQKTIIVPYGQGPTPTNTLTWTPAAEVTIPTATITLTSTPAPQGPISVDTVRQVDVLTKLFGNSDPVSSVAFNPSGTLLAAGSIGGAVRLWDLTTYAEIGALQSAVNRVDSVAISADGAYLAAAGQDNRVRLWALPGGNELAPLSGPALPVQSIAFSPVGMLLAAGSDDGQVYVWDVTTGQLVVTLAGHTSYVTSVAFNPDGTVLAAGGEDDTIRLWKIPGGSSLGVLQGHTANVEAVAFSPDGTKLASVSSGTDPTVRLWDVASQTQINTLSGHSENLSSVAFSPDGSLIASGAGGIEDNTVRLWSVQTGESLRTLYADGPVLSLAFSQDGRFLATGGSPASLTLWAVTVPGQTVLPQPAVTITAAPTLTSVPASGGEAAATPVQQATAVPLTVSGEGCVLIARFENVNLRTGPGVGYDLVGTLTLNQQVQANGWATGADGYTWWRLTNGAWARGDTFSNATNLPQACFELPKIAVDDLPPPQQQPDTDQVAPAATNTPVQSCQMTPVGDEVNRRAGPGTDYAIMDTLTPAQAVQANGWAFDAEGFVWWRLANGGWVRADTVEWPDVCTALPQVQP
jgi:WD40 repeat protein/uncharacterized protein YraI